MPCSRLPYSILYSGWYCMVWLADRQLSLAGHLCGVEVVLTGSQYPLFHVPAINCNRMMPKAEVGDFVVVADTGAYTLSMYSRYGVTLHLTLER